MPYPLRIEYPALSRAQLRAIGERCGDDPVVRRLLWEIRALQNLVLRAHQVAESAGPGGRTDAFGIAVEALHHELAAETWLQEDLAERAAYRAAVSQSDPMPHEHRSQRRGSKP